MNYYFNYVKLFKYIYKKQFDFNIKFINKEKDNVSGQGLFI